VCLVAFLGAFTLASGFASFLQSCVSTRHAWRVSRGDLAPPDEDAFLAYRGGTVDHYVYYTGIGSAVDAARDSDILVLGNSHAGLGLDPATLRSFRAETGVTIYNLSFNLNERAGFAREVLRRHDLRPKIALVNADYFFADGMSAAGEKITREGEWRAVMNWVEKNARHAVARRLHRWLPYFDWAARVTGDGLVYRSPADGAWLSVKGPHGDQPLERPSVDDGRPSPEEIRYAQDFRDELAANGSALILTWVPHPGGSRSRAELLANALDVKFLRGTEEGLRLRDHSHLTPQSASRFTQSLLEELVTLDLIIPLLAGGTP
jgi:hypothetical protein